MNLFGRIIKKLKNRYLRHFIYSVAAILFCLLFVTITGWALFSSTVSAGKSVLEAAVFGVEVAIRDEDGNTEKTEGLVTTGEYTITLSPGSYNITLAADGTVSEKVSGYGKVAIGSDDPLYTTPMYKGDMISFTILLDQETEITFSFNWGSLKGDVDIDDGTVIDKTTDKSKSTPTTSETRTTQTTAETSTTTTEATTTQTTPTTIETQAATEPGRTSETTNFGTTTATTSTGVKTTENTTTTTHMNLE